MRSMAVARRTTIRQIADQAGVSIATVSRVLNGRGDVSDDTRDLVSRVSRENGYTANRSARGLSAGRTGLVGVLVPLVYPAYFSGILAGAAEALSERDLQIVLSPTAGEHDREVSVLDRLHGLTDGALIILPEESNEELERLLDGGYRFVVIDPLMPIDERIPSVSAAHTSGADQAMRHLLELGHRRIAQITGPRGWLATEDRRRGYRAALASAGVLPDPSLEVEAIPEIAPGRAAAEYLLDLPERPTAIFAFNDNIAIGTIQAARARGLRVPDDLSVVGFDDVEHATIVTPSLTTVRQPLAEMGRTAVSLLNRLLEGQRFETLHVELATRLVVRDSTAPPRGA
jgi:LacI family transcriptional regulator